MLFCNNIRTTSSVRTGHAERGKIIQLLLVNAEEDVVVPDAKRCYTKSSGVINFMVENKDAEDKIKSQSSIYDSGMYDMLWTIYDSRQGNTVMVLFPRRNGLSYSINARNSDATGTDKFKYFVSQSLLPTQMNPNTAVQIVSFNEEQTYWKYRGLYHVAKELKFAAPVERSISFPNKSPLTISEDTQMFLSVR